MSFVIYAISVVGETNRAPFDLAEAESELVGGFHTEYSSFKFAMFFLAEYINMVTVSALATTLFLGGWRAPWPLSLWDGANHGWWPMLWFTGKVIVGIFVFVWLRGTLPRLRYDQFMAFGWKVLIPINLVWILAVTAIHVLRDQGWESWKATALPLAIVLLVVVVPGADGRRGRGRRARPPNARRTPRTRPPRRGRSPSRRWTSWCRTAAASRPQVLRRAASGTRADEGRRRCLMHQHRAGGTARRASPRASA